MNSSDHEHVPAVTESELLLTVAVTVSFLFIIIKDGGMPDDTFPLVVSKVGIIDNK